MIIGSVAACTQLLGDDFVVVVVAAGGSSSSSSGGAGGTTGDGGTSQGGSGGSGPCDVFAQDCGTMTAADKCIPTAEGGVCVASGSLPHEAACIAVHPGDDFDDCAPGLICHLGECLHICTGDPADPRTNSCPSTETCVESASYNWCGLGCDPLLQDCDAGQGCYLMTLAGGGVGLTCADVVDPPSAPNAPCMYLNDCQAGWQCSQALTGCNGNGCCAELCEVGVTACSTAGMSCQGLSGLPPELGYLGICWF